MTTIKLYISNDLHIITNLTKEQYKELEKFKGGFISNGPCNNKLRCSFCQKSETMQFKKIDIFKKKYDIGVNEHLLSHFLEFLYKQNGHNDYSVLDRNLFKYYFK
jgi:hypothetical protein